MFIERDYPEKTWSLSKQRLFEECKRKYYYRTFMGWNGWKRDASEKVRQAYLLGKLQNVYTLTGQAVHEEIKNAIGSRSFSVPDSFERVRHLLRRAWSQSVENAEEWKDQPKKYTMLFEIYYGKKEWLRKKSKEILQRVKTSLENFERSGPYRSILENRAETIEVDEDFPSFEHDGVRIFSIIDLLYRDLEKDTVNIIDWKTGTPSPKDDSFQLRLYTDYVLKKYPDIELSKVMCVNEYLLAGGSIEYSFNSKEIAEIDEYISKSLEELDGFLEDPETNKPKDMDFFPVDRGDKCNFCEFREICFAQNPAENGGS